jgi:hypothetical protein
MTLAIAACSFGGIDQARAQNLVQDPGFEASISSEVNSNPFWTIGNAGQGETFFAQNSGGGCAECADEPTVTEASHSGNWFVKFGATSPSDALTSALTQTITTVPGTTYLVGFFLANEGGLDNSFTATFDGQTVVSLTQQDAFDYTYFTGTAVASGNSAVLSFAGEQQPAYYLLDDVSVEAAPAPVAGGGTASAVLAIATIALYRRRRAAI